MTTELTILGWAIALGIVQVLVAGAMGTAQRGLKWNVSNRDEPVAALTGAAARAERASRNFLETFAFFASAALAVVLSHRGSPNTALGAEVYLWARVAYFPVYIVGVPYLRTIIYGFSLWGILQLLKALLY